MMRRASLIYVLTLACGALASGLVWAHSQTRLDPGMPALAWPFEPWVSALMLLGLLCYGVGLRRLHHRGGRGRAAYVGQAAAFVSGWLALLLAIDSPIEVWNAALFSMHMVQHELLMAVAAPLLVVGRPLATWRRALPIRARRGLGRTLGKRSLLAARRTLALPAPAWLLNAAALWIWHVPPLFEAALAHPWIHALQHTSFFLSALIYWWTVFGPRARHDRSGQAMVSVFTTMIHTGALGALLTFTPTLWYPSYAPTCAALGVDPLRDQELGGLVMWVPGGFVYLIAAMCVAARWLMGRAGPVLAAGAASTHPPG